MPDLLVRHAKLRAIAATLNAGSQGARFALPLFQPIDDMCRSMSVAGALAGATTTQSWAATGVLLGLEASAVSAISAGEGYEAADAQLASRASSASPLTRTRHVD